MKDSEINAQYSTGLSRHNIEPGWVISWESGMCWARV
jgi:hypothetical protein